MKKLIIVAGFACKEKTKFAKDLASKLGYAYVNKDSVCKELTDYVMKKTISAKEKQNYIYRSEVNRIEYVSTLKVCKDIIDSGINVVVEMPLASQIENYEKFKLLSVIAGLSFDIETKFIWVKHNLENTIANPDSKDFDPTSWNEYISLQDGLQIDDDYHCIEIENDSPIEEVIQQLSETSENN